MAKTRRQKERRRASASQAAKEQKFGGERTAFRIPEGMEIWRPEKASTYDLDIIEYPVGEGNPYAAKGETFHSRSFWVHHGIGANEQTFCCLAKNWGESCPICEEQRQLDRDPDVDERTVDALKPKLRQIFVVVDTDNRDNGFQLFEESHHSLGRTINDRINEIVSDPKSGQEEINEWEHFYYWDEGSTLRITFEDKSWIDSSTGKPGKPWRHVLNVRLKKRQEDYDESIVDEVPCLDDLLIKVPYDKLKAILHQTGEPMDEEEETEDEDERPKSNRRWRDVEEEEEPFEKDPEPENESEEEPDGWEDEDEDEEPKPKRRGSARRTRKSR